MSVVVAGGEPEVIINGLLYYVCRDNRRVIYYGL